MARQWGIVEPDAVSELAADILNPQRERPIVVVTTRDFCAPSAVARETIEAADEVARAVGDIADVAILATGPITRALEALLPDRWHVFNGAARSYPVGVAADPDIRRSPLRWSIDAVIGDALRHASDAGAFDAPTATQLTKNGEVRGVLGESRALVDVGAGMPAVVWRELTFANVPLTWLLQPGSQVSGEHDLTQNRLVLHRVPWNAAALLDRFPHGSVTLALVDAVAPDRATVRLHPAVAVQLSAIDVTSNPHDRLDLLLVVGEVVRVRVVHHAGDVLHLRLSDLDDDEPVLPAVELIEGGTSWLVEGRTLPPESDGALEAPPQAGPAMADAGIAAPTVSDAGADSVDRAAPPASGRQGPLPGPGPRKAVPLIAPATGPVPAHGRTAAQSMELTIVQLKAEVVRLRERLADAGAADGAHAALVERAANAERRAKDALADLGEANRKIRELSEQHAQSARALRARAKAVVTPARSRVDRRAQWADDESWLRHEIVQAWAERVPSFEKGDYPLPTAYRMGPRFAASVNQLDEGQFEKALKTVVDVLTDRAKDLDSRELHVLRDGKGGDARDVVRDDGARCWRAAIERNSPSARRLHYWQGNGGAIELSRVVLHDDVEP